MINKMKGLVLTIFAMVVQNNGLATEKLYRNFSYKDFIEVQAESSPMHSFRLLREGLLITYTKEKKCLTKFIAASDLRVKAVLSLQSYISRTQSLLKDSVYEVKNRRMFGQYMIFKLISNDRLFKVDWRSGEFTELDSLLVHINAVIPEHIRSNSRFVGMYLK